jgi:hypothetical protein
MDGFIGGEQLFAEQTNAGAGIEDNIFPIIQFDIDTGCVPAKFHHICVRNRN